MWKKRIPFQPNPDFKIPKPCVEKGLKYKVCGECPNFKVKPEIHTFIEYLTVHHKDGNKKNQNPANLVTVCTSCARRFHHRDRLLTIDEVKKIFKN
jgi:5-methylcytosine-specific restriction endonuclease McrA